MSKHGEPSANELERKASNKCTDFPFDHDENISFKERQATKEPKVYTTSVMNTRSRSRQVGQQGIGNEDDVTTGSQTERVEMSNHSNQQTSKQDKQEGRKDVHGAIGGSSDTMTKELEETAEMVSVLNQSKGQDVEPLTNIDSTLLSGTGASKYEISDKPRTSRDKLKEKEQNYKKGLSDGKNTVNWALFCKMKEISRNQSKVGSVEQRNNLSSGIGTCKPETSDESMSLNKRTRWDLVKEIEQENITSLPDGKKNTTNLPLFFEVGNNSLDPSIETSSNSFGQDSANNSLPCKLETNTLEFPLEREETLDASSFWPTSVKNVDISSSALIDSVRPEFKQENIVLSSERTEFQIDDNSNLTKDRSSEDNRMTVSIYDSIPQEQKTENADSSEQAQTIESEENLSVDIPSLSEQKAQYHSDQEFEEDWKISSPSGDNYVTVDRCEIPNNASTTLHPSEEKIFTEEFLCLDPESQLTTTQEVSTSKHNHKGTIRPKQCSEVLKKGNSQSFSHNTKKSEFADESNKLHTEKNKLSVEQKTASQGGHTPNINRPYNSEKTKAIRNVWNNLKEHFKTRYKKKNNALKLFPVESKLTETHVDLLFNCKEDDGKMFFGIYRYRSFEKKFLFVGLPGFGKTTLFNVFAYQWASSCGTIGFFKLCISLRLMQLDFSQADLSQSIINELMERLGQEGTSNLFEQSLADNSEDIVLLLDGYDEINETARRCVSRFLQKPGCFEKSAIAVSTRPVAKDDIASLFNKCYKLEGITDRQMNEICRSMDVMPDRLKQHELYTFLKDTPPFFAYFMSLIGKYPGTSNKPKNLYSICNHALHLVSEYDNRYCKLFPFKTEWNERENMHLRLGELFFEALMKRRYIFTDEFLISRLGQEETKTWVQKNIFTQARHGAQDNKTWAVSCKLLMVFLATKYLMNEWSHLTTRSEKAEFLKNTIFGSACSGDYILGRGQPATHYLVGLIPEIVLKLDQNNSLAETNFVMYYDAEGLEKSNSFDSVNVLARTEQRLLPRFYFKSLNADDKMYTLFQNHLGNVDLGNSCIEYNFYYNSLEEKKFLAVSAENDEQATIFHAIFRKNSMGTTDRIHLEFPLSDLDEVFPSLWKIVHSALRGFSLADEMWSSREEFVYKLVGCLLGCELKRSVLVTCMGNVEMKNMRLQCAMTFQISVNPERPQARKVLITAPLPKTPYADKILSYEKDEFSSDCDNFILKFTSKCISGMVLPRVSVDLF